MFDRIIIPIGTLLMPQNVMPVNVPSGWKRVPSRSRFVNGIVILMMWIDLVNIRIRIGIRKSGLDMCRRKRQSRHSIIFNLDSRVRLVHFSRRL